MSLLGLLIILCLIFAGFWAVSTYMPATPPFLRWIGFGFCFICLFAVIWQAIGGNTAILGVRLR